MSYIPLRKAVERLGLHPHTLRKYADEGIIPSIRHAAGQRMFAIDSYLRVAAKPTVIGYCRVSSPKQRDDLERQIDRVRSTYPDELWLPTVTDLPALGLRRPRYKWRSRDFPARLGR